MSYTVQYPIRFYSNGDTTSQAIYKHIQEFESLYGKLNAFNASKADKNTVENDIESLKNSLESKVSNIQLIKGAKGDKGEPGENGTTPDINITVEFVRTRSAGEEAFIDNVGYSELGNGGRNYLSRFYIPRGQTGDTGADGTGPSWAGGGDHSPTDHDDPDGSGG